MEKRISASKLTGHMLLFGAYTSKWPFAHPPRLPVSRLPARGRRSRPHSSMPARTPSSPFGFFATPLNPVSPGPGGIKAMNPLPDFILAFPAAAEFPLPLEGDYPPPDRSVPSSLPPEKLTVRFARFPFAPR